MGLLTAFALAGCADNRSNDPAVVQALSVYVPLPECEFSMKDISQVDLSEVPDVNPERTLFLEATFELPAACNDNWERQLVSAGFHPNSPHGCCYRGALDSDEAFVMAHRENDTERFALVPISEPIASVAWYEGNDD